MRLRFVNREEELNALIELAYHGSYLPVYLYGPEGCGKTRLLQELITRLGEDTVTVYIDALEREHPGKSLVIKGVKLASNLVEDLASLAPFSRVLARGLRDLVEKLATRLTLRGKRLVILVDDVTGAISVEDIEWYVKYLQSLIEELQVRYDLESIAIIVTTSEGQSLEKVVRHTYARPRLIWNLDLDSAMELIEQLKPPSMKIAEEALRITGGNPRAIIDVALSHDWKLKEWLNEIRLVRIEHVFSEIRARGLEKEVLKLLENPDELYENPNQRLLEAYRILVNHNFMIYKAIPLIHGKRLKPSRELGVGEYYAWQIPAYRDILREKLEQTRH